MSDMQQPENRCPKCGTKIAGGAEGCRAILHHLNTVPSSQDLMLSVERWAETVWQLWPPHHALARQWGRTALGESA